MSSSFLGTSSTTRFIRKPEANGLETVGFGFIGYSFYHFSLLSRFVYDSPALYECGGFDTLVIDPSA